jgi:PhzF family phenazine biosynthesis protein
MRLQYFHVDAFSDAVFSGNPAGVCLLDKWLPTALMQQIAFENNLSETAFVMPARDYYGIRWFTPTVEVDLCGHATLAAAHVLFQHQGFAGPVINFRSNTDRLAVAKRDGLLVLDFPSRPPLPCATPNKLVQALGQAPLEVLAARDYFVVYPSEEIVRNLKPDMGLLCGLDKFAVIVTAKGKDVDFVSRFFAPKEGVPEDPVTGSAHCSLTPYWAKKLGKNKMTALQVSARGGKLFCEDAGERVKIGGTAVTYLQGWIEV